MRTWIEHLGHTSFGIVRGGLRILIDPIIVRRDLDFRRPTCPQWFFDDLTECDAIFISHGHNDHLHPPSLLGFPQDMQIYFLDENSGIRSHDEDPRQLLSNLGFQNIRPFDSGDVIELAEEVKIHIVPAQTSSEGEKQCCFFIETPDALVLDAVDIRDTPVTRQALERYRGQIDVAFVPTGAAVQWQGFWNQMDAIEALAFCKWLQPAKVATCGGSLSLSERPRLGTLERYPNDLADWLATATAHLAQDQLLRQRPPFRLLYDSHRLLRCTPMWPASRFQSRNGSFRPQAVVTTFFTGYHPQLPTKRLVWHNNSLQDWLGTLQVIREIIRNSEGNLRYLVERCQSSVNRTPAGVLVPCTLRRLVAGRAFDLAARITAYIPKAPSNSDNLEMSFFALAEALVENTSGLLESMLEDLRVCLWIDRNMFHQWNLHLQLKRLASFPEGMAADLLSQHLESLQATVDQRRLLLGPNHFRLQREQVHLLTSKPPSSETAGLLCYAGPVGVHQTGLTAVESVLLDLCDGRTFAGIVEEVRTTFEMPEAEVKTALLKFLTRLSRDSVLLVDWSQ